MVCFFGVKSQGHLCFSKIYLMQKLATGISLAICGFEILFLGGVLFAWNPVLYTFIEDGIFADKCYHDNVTKVYITKDTISTLNIK